MNNPRMKDSTKGYTAGFLFLTTGKGKRKKKLKELFRQKNSQLLWHRAGSSAKRILITLGWWCGSWFLNRRFSRVFLILWKQSQLRPKQIMYLSNKILHPTCADKEFYNVFSGWTGNNLDPRPYILVSFLKVIIYELEKWLKVTEENPYDRKHTKKRYIS